MKAVRLLSTALKIISLFTFGGCLFFFWLFYVFYLRWVFLFENGRYFDPVEEVVYQDSSSVLGIFSLFLLLFSVVLCLLASRVKSNRDVNFEKRDE
jgi:hypothetical protein